MDFQALIMVIALASFPFLQPQARSETGMLPNRDSFQQSGIEGKVSFLSGNRMPSKSPGPRSDSISVAGKPPDATASGVLSTVCVFGLTNDRQVVRQGNSPYCQAVHTRLIRQTVTDDKGNFRILLSPGTYSVFTKKGDLFYATRRDEKNNIAPVVVTPGKMTWVNCSVESDHKVVY